MHVNWDITYACPLRCSHCYSESGRRAARTPDADRVLRITHALIAAGVRSVAFSGGEPTLVHGVAAAARKLLAASVEPFLYTSGYGLERALALRLVGSFRQIHLSVDGAGPETHDRIRGRRGSFDEALLALETLTGLAEAARTTGAPAAGIGLEYTVVRSNLHDIEPFCREMTGRFPSIDFITIGAAVPSGLASREGYADAELLDAEGLALLRSARFLRRLRTLVPGSVKMSMSDNWHLMPPGLGAFDRDPTLPIQIEPDGDVRAFPIYEGIVGNLLEEPLRSIWRRARQRHRDPRVVELLSGVTTMQGWAAAARQIDARFAAQPDLVRIRKRPEWVANDARGCGSHSVRPGSAAHEA